MPASSSNRDRGRSAPPLDDLDRARTAYAGRAWADALEAFERADRHAPLASEDLDRLAWAGVLAGRDDVHLAALERLHDRYEKEGQLDRAAQAAFWIAFRLIWHGEMGQAGGWIGRTARLLERHGAPCVVSGYLCVPEAYGLIARSQDLPRAIDLARQASASGERFEHPDLTHLGRLLEGLAHVAQGEARAGLALLDESMLAATTGLLTPMVTGIVYCSVIECCQRVYAIDRAREWTVALGSWCDQQPQLVGFTGACRVHRSEILQLQGAWPEALQEAKRAAQLLQQSRPPMATALARYQEGEIHRLRGEFEAAEAAYRDASREGRDPQPGLALLRLAQGKSDSAAAAIRLAVKGARGPLARAKFLPAAVEILLAAGDLAGAQEAARDLESIAREAGNEVLDAIAAHARGAVLLAVGDAAEAIEPLRAALELWQRVGAPYLAARLRVLIAKALAALGDHDGAELERDAARAVFCELAAAPDLARLDAPPAEKASSGAFGLTPREIEVLRLVATGLTNRAISERLFLSEKTVDRHVSNIFTKLDVSTRAAATAFAYQHKLV